MSDYATVRADRANDIVEVLHAEVQLLHAEVHLLKTRLRLHTFLIWTVLILSGLFLALR